MLIVLLSLVHVIVCLFLIVVVLLQSGKAADLAGAFGGMGSQTAFGPRGSATLLSKATTISAIVFMMTSMGLSIMATRTSGGAKTVLDSAAPGKAPAKTAPARPGIPGKTMPMPLPQMPVQKAPVTPVPVTPAPATPAPAKK